MTFKQGEITKYQRHIYRRMNVFKKGYQHRTKLVKVENGSACRFPHYFG